MITASVVLYKTDCKQIYKLIECIQKSKSIDWVYFIDNSPEDSLKSLIDSFQPSEYIFNNANIGYGAAHNIAIKKAIQQGSEYHLILNPDISFFSDVINELAKYMDQNQNAVYVLPKVVYPNGELQYLCKLLPTVSDLIFRRFIPNIGFLKGWKEKKDNYYCLKNFGYNKIINPPCLSGCFMFLRVSTLKNNNILFDDTFFMYFEDFDLIRRLHRIGETVFYPNVTIIHDHARASYKSRSMLKAHIKSAIHYFNKYGWFIDKERKIMNKKILSEIY